MKNDCLKPKEVKLANISQKKQRLEGLKNGSKGKYWEVFFEFLSQPQDLSGDVS